DHLRAVLELDFEDTRLAQAAIAVEVRGIDRFGNARERRIPALRELGLVHARASMETVSLSVSNELIDHAPRRGNPAPDRACRGLRIEGRAVPAGRRRQALR